MQPSTLVRSMYSLAMLVLLLGARPAALAQEVEDHRVVWLRRHAAALRSIDPNEAGSADLEAMRRALAGVRVVMLGEQSHGDGATFLAKVRLVKFLHETMGFDVIAFESGLFDCTKAWEQIRSGGDPVAAASRGVFSIWTESAQVRPLFDFIAAASRGPRPLELAGFDLQFTGKASREQFVPELEQFLASSDPALAESEPWRVVKKSLLLHFGDAKAWRATPAEEQSRVLDAVVRLTASLERPRGKAPGDPAASAFWVQNLRSAHTLFRFLWNADFQRPDPKVLNLRDEQMAENLLWLAEQRYPGRRIIVWGATSHVSRNRALIETQAAPGMVPMGDYVHKALGSAAYTIGFTAYQGSMGFPREGERGLPRDIGVAADGSLEALFAGAGFAQAFLDLRNLPDGGAWLKQPLVSRPMGYSPMRADWTRVLDGLVFIREMTPSTRTSSLSR